MIIEQILKHKGREIVSIPPNHTLRDAASVLDERRVGAVVILNEQGELVGVLSERDIVRQVARLGHDALDMPVSSAMTRAVITVFGSTPAAEAMQTMTDRRIRHLPVIDGSRMIGLVSIGDLVKWKIAETEAESEAMRSYLSAQF